MSFHYAYKCNRCGLVVIDARAVANRNKPKACKCGGKLLRDIAAEGTKGRTGDLPDWLSTNAGVLPLDVARANRHYGPMGVQFDRKGRAMVPGNVRKKFLKERGLVEI